MNLEKVPHPPIKIVNKRLSIAAGVDLPNKSLHDSDEAKHRRRHSRGLSKSLNISKITVSFYKGWLIAHEILTCF